MIEIVTPQNRKYYERQLEDMHRMRYRTVVEKWGWDVPTARDGHDIDPFDAKDTVYILHLNSTRDVVEGCCRLNPTIKPTMLSDIYADACDLKGPPKDPEIWESSRFVITDDLDSKEQYLEVLWRVGVGINEFCLRSGIKQIAWYTSPPFYHAICSVMRVTPLGRPFYNNADDDTYTAALSDVDEESLRKMRANLQHSEIDLCFMFSPLSRAAVTAASTPKLAA